jgi:parallel beta-helix repeat protein
MPRSFGVVVVVALMTWALLGMLAGRALGNHVQCGDVITQDTTLDSDLVDCPGDGIVIGADGVTLDLNGHTVDGDVDPSDFLGCDTGIVNGRSDNCAGYPGPRGHSGVTVKNGAVRQFAFGVQAVAGDANSLLRLRVSGSSSFAAISTLYLSNSLIEGTQAFDNRGAGIGLYEPSERNRLVRNVVARNGGHGIEMASAEFNRLEGNVVFENFGDGIHASDARDNLLRGNRVFANGGDGMELSDGVFDNLIERNRVWDNALAGILLMEGAHRNRVVANTVFENALETSADESHGGVVLWEGHDDLFADNRVFENGGAGGIAMTDAHDNVIARNHVMRNTADGIEVGPTFHDPSNILVEANRAQGNGDDGIDVEAPGTTVTTNLAAGNLDLGIEAVPGVIDGRANRAFHNGNPLQCLNVVCGPARGGP